MDRIYGRSSLFSHKLEGNVTRFSGHVNRLRLLGVNDATTLGVRWGSGLVRLEPGPCSLLASGLGQTMRERFLFTSEETELSLPI